MGALFFYALRAIRMTGAVDLVSFLKKRSHFLDIVQTRFFSTAFYSKEALFY